MIGLEASWPIGHAPAWPGQLEDFGARQLFIRRSSTTSDEPAPRRAVLIHGLGGQSTNWTDLMGLLRNEVDQVALDLPGCGYSPPALDGDYSLNSLTAAAYEVLVEEFENGGGSPVHLFGNSLGGAIAVRLTAEHPDLVASLVLTSPALPDLVPRRHTMGVPLVALPGLGEFTWRRMARVPVDRQVEAMLSLNYADPSVVSVQRREEAIADYRRRYLLDHAGHAVSGSARGLLRAFLDTGSANLWRQAAAIECPTLAIYGGKDRLVRARKSAKAARFMPAARVVVLPQVGHVAQLEAPELVGRLVADFWSAASTD